MERHKFTEEFWGIWNRYGWGCPSVFTSTSPTVGLKRLVLQYSSTRHKSWEETEGFYLRRRWPGQWFYSVPPGKFCDPASNKPRQLACTSFSIHHSPVLNYPWPCVERLDKMWKPTIARAAWKPVYIYGHFSFVSFYNEKCFRKKL